jgi:hypothetical protein
VVFVFHAMKSASGLQVAKLGIDCFVGRAYFSEQRPGPWN